MKVFAPSINRYKLLRFLNKKVTYLIVTWKFSDSSFSCIYLRCKIIKMFIKRVIAVILKVHKRDREAQHEKYVLYGIHCSDVRVLASMFPKVDQ